MALIFEAIGFLVVMGFLWYGVVTAMDKYFKNRKDLK